MPAPSLFLKLFPPPRYLASPVAGLDVSAGAVKFITLVPVGDHFAILNYGERAIPLGTMSAGRVKEPAVLIGILQNLAKEFGLWRVSVSLPETEAFMVRLTLPAMARHDLRSSIELELEEHVPLPIDNVVFDYEILSTPKNDQDHFSVAVAVLPKNAAGAYLAVLRQAGLFPEVLETEAYALARALRAPTAADTALIIDLGKTRTGLAAVVGRQVLFSSIISAIGSDDINRIIAKHLNVPLTVAEEQKQKFGLSRAPANQELFFALITILSALKDEINTNMEYWNKRFTEDAPALAPISQIILAGGQATMPGLVEYLTENLKLPVTIGNPWVNVIAVDKFAPPIAATETPRYATALGLALRGAGYFNHD